MEFIKNQDEVKITQNKINNIDVRIQLIENDILKIDFNTNNDLIIKYQELIDRLKRLRLGYFNAIALFNSKNDNNTNQMAKIRVEQDMSLIDITNAFYDGNNEYYQYIYEYNNLTSPLLSINQEIFIPILPKSPESILYQEDIILAEIVQLSYQRLGYSDE